MGELSTIELATMCIIRVYGKPEPAGSKRAFAAKKGGEYTGRVNVIDDNPESKTWKKLVADAARERYGERPLLSGPLYVSMCFYLPRPNSHFGTGRNAGVLKRSAPAWPITRPDSLKLARGTEDALTGVVWGDDAQVVDLSIVKNYVPIGGEPGVLITAATR